MDTKALRQKILDLAIRGKLVPQDPNDEPASVLLERIRAEKQQMVKDGKLKAKDIKNDTVIFKGDDNLHYEQFQDGTVKCIEDEIPFELPDGWAWARLGVICPYGENKAVSADLIDETAWILDLEDIEKETGVIKKYTTKSERNSVSNKYSFCKGQLLYSKLRPYLNKVVIATKDGYCTTEILPLTFYGNIYSPYMQLFIMSPTFLTYVMKQLGYVIDLNPYHKYATIRSVNSKKETRLYRLGEAYDRDAIYDQMRDTLRNNPQEAYRLYYEFTEKKSFGVTIQKAHFVKGNLKTAKKITGLKALYFRYLYLLGVLPKNKKHNPLSPEMREACRWLDRHTAQVQLICDNHLTDISSVEVFIKHTDSEIKLISDYRKMLYRDIDSCHDPDEKTKLVVKRDDCTKALAQLRKDRKTAARIIEDNPKIKENILIEENMRSRYFGLNKSRKRGYER